MADRTLVLCSPLCFILEKFGNKSIKLLRSALVDFYDIAAVSEAKARLLNDVSSLNLTDKPPHIPTRRDGENRLTKEVDDILSLLSFLDENGCLMKLPQYVSDGQDSMPSFRIYESDLKVLMIQLEKMESNMEGLTRMINDFACNVQSLRKAYTACTTSAATVTAINNPTTGQGRLSVPMPLTKSTAGSSSTTLFTTGPNQVDSEGRQRQRQQQQQQQHGQLPTDWASRVTLASTPAQSNRFSSLATTDDESNDDIHAQTETEGEAPYTLVQSRRSARAKRRRRSGSSNHVAAAAVTPSAWTSQPNQDNQQPKQPKQRRHLMIGKSTGEPTTQHLVAAKPLFKKAVFCIDNLDASVTEQDVVNFVKSLSVRVISCFEAKSRRRRSDNDSSTAERKAFRLCIPEDDKYRLLDDSRWPAYITVSEWYFKSRQQDTTVKQTISRSTDQEQCQQQGGTAPQNSSDVRQELLDANDETVNEKTVIMSVDELTVALNQPNMV